MHVVDSGQRSAGCRWLATHVRPEEQPRLAVQGRVTWESLPSGRRCAKLRFRDSQGRQRVRYIGVDEELANSVSSALAQRQRSHRFRRETHRLSQQCGQIMRDVKRRLEPHLAETGWRFHGQALRCRRHVSAGDSQYKSGSPTPSGGLPPMTDIPDPTPNDPADSLSRRIGDDCREWAEQQPTAPDRALGYAVATMAQMGAFIAGPINSRLETARDPLDALQQLHPDIELALKVNRQFERLCKSSIAERAKQLSPPKRRNRQMIPTSDGAPAARERSRRNGRGRTSISIPYAWLIQTD